MILWIVVASILFFLVVITPFAIREIKPEISSAWNAGKQRALDKNSVDGKNKSIASFLKK